MNHAERAKPKIPNYNRAMRILRAALNISQKDLAERSQVNASYVSLIESEQREPTVRTLRKVAKGLGISFDEFTLLAMQPGELGIPGPCSCKKTLGENVL